MTPSVLITGCSSGIGRATALYFQQNGWRVFATLRQVEAEQELNQLEGVTCLPLDVTNEAQVQHTIAQVLAAGPLDVVVSNAGYGTIGAFEAATTEQILQQFDTNLFGAMRVIRAVLPHFRERRQGTIVQVGSWGGRVALPLGSVYHGSQWALQGFLESLHYELRQFGIRVKIIEPGPTQTDFFGRSQVFFDRPDFNVYEAYVARTMANLQQMGIDAPGAEDVAEVVYRAATSSSSKLRYPVGIASRWFRWRKWLPASWFRRLVRSKTEEAVDRLRNYRQEIDR